MVKSTYYVSVQAGTILQEQGDAAYEFVIEATPKEVNQLQELIDMKLELGTRVFFQGPRLFEDQRVEFNRNYDSQLNDIYQFISELGTETTKQHIASMGVLDQ